MKYEFSVPMPFQMEHIKQLLDINNKVKKSKITSLYFSLPTNSVDFTGFEQDRILWDFITDFEYWKTLIQYSLENNFEFVYVLNSPKIHNEGDKDLKIKLEKLDKLINNLKNIGCNKFRVSNPQLMGYLNKNYPYTQIYISTSTEMQSIQQYTNLFYLFGNIKEVVPSWNLNRNFKFLKNIQKLFPDIKIELMVNEGCIPACPFREIHNNWFNLNSDTVNPNFYFSTTFFKETCKDIMNKNLFYYFANSNIIYPWNIDKYYDIGINKFKLVGRNNSEFKSGHYIKYYEYYLNGVDDIRNVYNIPIKFFNNYLCKYVNLNETVKDLIKYLPDINHFKKYGHLCSSICGVKCKYCYRCAGKIQKKFERKMKKNFSHYIPACVIN